jgi:hypothetical protein
MWRRRISSPTRSDVKQTAITQAADYGAGLHPSFSRPRVVDRHLRALSAGASAVAPGTDMPFGA